MLEAVHTPHGELCKRSLSHRFIHNTRKINAKLPNPVLQVSEQKELVGLGACMFQRRQQLHRHNSNDTKAAESLRLTL